MDLPPLPPEKKPVFGPQPRPTEAFDYEIFDTKPRTKEAHEHVDRERDCLDEALELMDHAQEKENHLDNETMSIAAKLVEKGDQDSVLKAHKLLTTCGAHLGIWSIGEKPDPALQKKAQRLGTKFFDAAKLERDFKDYSKPVGAWDGGNVGNDDLRRKKMDDQEGSAKDDAVAAAKKDAAEDAAAKNDADDAVRSEGVSE
mmetsp:Transcript_12590/g.41265  ORF Transcript_12590/g.41265 Transcript_12590/m.41265 type:complete len:200 (+) Transcript_12590:286-885(+)